MKLFMTIQVLFLATSIWGACPSRILSVGNFSFKVGNQAYVADTTHARGYANQTTGIGYITAANSHNMVVDISKKDMKSVGTYVLKARDSKVIFTLGSKSYSLRNEQDYLRITITSARTAGSFSLLNGRFEGQLTDKLGNVVKITEGYFETKNL